MTDAVVASVVEQLDLTYFFSGLVAWSAIFSVFRRLSKEAWSVHSVSYRDQWEWLLRCVSSVHASFVAWNALGWLYALLFEHVTEDDLVLGSLPGAGIVVSISLSYFVWDLVFFSYADMQVALKWKDSAEAAIVAKEPVPPRPRMIGGAVFIAHHVFSALGLATAVVFDCYPIALAVGIALEITTPFLNATWLCETVHMEWHPLYRLCGYVFASLWTVFRLAGPAWCLLHFVSTYAIAAAALPWFVVLLFAVAIPGFNVLNWFWFSKIVARLIRKHKELKEKSM